MAGQQLINSNKKLKQTSNLSRLCSLKIENDNTNKKLENNECEWCFFIRFLCVFNNLPLWSNGTNNGVLAWVETCTWRQLLSEMLYLLLQKLLEEENLGTPTKTFRKIYANKFLCLQRSLLGIFFVCSGISLLPHLQTQLVSRVYLGANEIYFHIVSDFHSWKKKMKKSGWKEAPGAIDWKTKSFSSLSPWSTPCLNKYAAFEI